MGGQLVKVSSMEEVLERFLSLSSLATSEDYTNHNAPLLKMTHWPAPHSGDSLLRE